MFNDRTINCNISEHIFYTVHTGKYVTQKTGINLGCTLISALSHYCHIKKMTFHLGLYQYYFDSRSISKLFR